MYKPLQYPRPVWSHVYCTLSTVEAECPIDRDDINTKQTNAATAVRDSLLHQHHHSNITHTIITTSFSGGNPSNCGRNGEPKVDATDICGFEGKSRELQSMKKCDQAFAGGGRARQQGTTPSKTDMKPIAL